MAFRAIPLDNLNELDMILTKAVLVR